MTVLISLCTRKFEPQPMLEQKFFYFAHLSEVVSFVLGTRPINNNTATAAAAAAARAAQAAARARAAATSSRAATPLERVRMYRTADPNPASVAAIPALEILQVAPASIGFQFVSFSTQLVLDFLALSTRKISVLNRYGLPSCTSLKQMVHHDCLVEQLSVGVMIAVTGASRECLLHVWTEHRSIYCKSALSNYLLQNICTCQ